MKVGLNDAPVGGEVGQVTITHGEGWGEHEPSLEEVTSPECHERDRQSTHSEGVPDSDCDLSEKKLKNEVSDLDSGHEALGEGGAPKEMQEAVEEQEGVDEEAAAPAANTSATKRCAISLRPD